MLNERVRDNTAFMLNDQVKCVVPACDILHYTVRLRVVLPDGLLLCVHGHVLVLALAFVLATLASTA